MSDHERGIRSGGAFHWFFQRVTGAFLLLVLLAHFWVLHFFPSGEHGEITYETVMARLQNPLWRAIDLLFLVIVLYHAQNGVMMVVHDYVHRPILRMLVVGALWIAALFFLVVGSMTIMGLA